LGNNLFPDRKSHHELRLANWEVGEGWWCEYRKGLDIETARQLNRDDLKKESPSNNLKHPSHRNQGKNYAQ
jgi:hypothetical protein